MIGALDSTKGALYSLGTVFTYLGSKYFISKVKKQYILRCICTMALALEIVVFFMGYHLDSGD